MSRLKIASPTRADIVMEELYKELERRIEASPPGLCPVDMARAFLELCKTQGIQGYANLFFACGSSRALL